MDDETDPKPVTTESTEQASPANTETGGAPPASTPETTPETTSGTEPTDMLSAVRAVLEPSAEPSPAGGSGAGEPDTSSGEQPAQPGAPDPNAPKPEDDKSDPTPDELNAITKPSMRKRLESMIADRAQLRTQVQQLTEPASNWEQHTRFCATNGIRPDDLNAGMGAMALLGRGDFANFLAAVQPYVDAANAALGRVLPKALQDRVDDGELTESAAHEISRAQAEAANVRRQTSLQAERVDQETLRARTTSVNAALGEWERDKRQRDPEFARKHDTVVAHAIALRDARGLPPDAPTAVAWADEALAAVNRLWAAARPDPKPGTAPRPSSVTSATRTAPEPKSMREAVELALARGR